MSDKKQFNLADLLKDMSEPDTGREQIEYIALDLIDGDANNFYRLNDLEDLAANISMFGLQQPIRLRPNPDAEGRYIIVSGHRRQAAIKLLAEEDPEKWKEISCIVNRTPMSPSLQQLQLIYANSNTRALTPAEISEQAVQVEKLLYQLKEEGYEFPGRMREHVAKAVNASTTKLARLKVIREGLAKCWQKDFKSNTLSESTAYELARLSLEDQQCIFDAKKATGANIRWLYADDVKTYGKRLAAIKKLKCGKSGEACVNTAGKRLETVKKERYCNSPCGQCCAKCDHLTSCKNACPKLADKIKQLKAEKRDASRQAKQAQAEKDRPIVEYIQRVYSRIAEARKKAGLDVQALYKAADRYWWPEEDKEQRERESGKAKIKVDTVLPLGRSFFYGDAKSLCGVADALGCSVDYLLCRTDIPGMAQESVPSPNLDTVENSATFASGAWYPATVEPPVGVRLIMIDCEGYIDDGKYEGAGKFSFSYGYPETPISLWTLMPQEKDVATAAPAVTGWHSGKPEAYGTYAAYICLKDAASPMLRELLWDGEEWLLFGNKIDENVTVQCWSERPEV